MLVTGVAFEVVGIEVEEIDRLLRFGQRFEAVLADFEHERGGDVVDALLHDRAGAADQGRALGGGRRAPGRIGRACRDHRGVGIVRVGQREGAEVHVAVDRTPAIRVVLGRPIGTADEERMAPAEACFDAGHRVFEALVHRFGRVVHGGVGQAETHGRPRVVSFCSSFPRRREPGVFEVAGSPACAGMTTDLFSCSRRPDLVSCRKERSAQATGRATPVHRQGRPRRSPTVAPAG